MGIGYKAHDILQSFNFSDEDLNVMKRFDIRDKEDNFN